MYFLKVNNLKDIIFYVSSFAIPSLAIKIDAYPGRLNEVSVYINRSGIFYGLMA